MPGNESEEWNQEKVDLATLPGKCAHPPLLFYVFGDQSVALAKAFASLASTEAKRQNIIEFFSPYFFCFPTIEGFA
jgi:hypothetical protein